MAKKRKNKEFINKIKQIRKYIRDSKTGKTCKDCKLPWPYYILQYDHVDPSKKMGNVSDLVKLGHSLDVIKNEIKKCDCICSNCHCIREHNRRNGKVYVKPHL